MSNIVSNQLVYNGELEGITLAIEHASTIARSRDSFRVYSDNQASLHRLKSLTNNLGQAQLVRALRATSQLIDTGANIALEWILGYKDILANELADSLAKAASIELEPESDQTSLAVLGLKVKKKSHEKWLASLNNQKASYYSRTFSWKTRSRIQLLRSTKRELASSFYQLKIAH